VIAAGDAFGKPAGDDADDDPGKDAHDPFSSLDSPALPT
jgi:hypothetical protein